MLWCPRSLIYIIDAYKFEAAVIGILTAVALSCSLMTVSERVQAEQHSLASAGQPYPTYPKGKATVAAAAAINGQGAAALWPLKGMVTTEFGAPHRPWQTTHTGIDISTGQPIGVARVAAFRSGTVVSTVWSGRSYGNHVTIDHGNGVTSVYGHLASISVRQGQSVAAGEALGTEGSTGASTGTHLHFEIQVNGRPVNPQRFIGGRP
ncbi:MAG TPA: M23 family metallopeptidase [Candidatus Saccharimonadales bacterium]|nr:M23 family metallopeptidase [Candidatus Saccharimonadales bacterium]